MNSPQPPNNPPTQLILAVVQAQDAEVATAALESLSLPVTRLPSTGGFLGRRNATLLVGVPAGQNETVLETLNRTCRQRVEYIAVPLESAPLPLPAPTPITIGGATLFGLPVDYFEEL